MDFFERQRQVKNLSARLVALFVLAVIGIVIAVDVAVVAALGLFGGSAGDLTGTLVFTSLATLAAIGLASLVRTVGLRGGGAKVAIELGGIPVPEDTTDQQLRRLRNVVEEVALASGVPVPAVFVLENERAINAFAAGWSPADAAVAVTRGALDRLNRDELQGVIAHEFSHVVNGDMRLNIKLIGLLFGILFLAVVGRIFVNAGIIGGRRDSREGNNPLPLIGLALVAVGFLGVLAGRIIQSSVSRQREYLADASAVQFTRQTAGIAGALKKIGGLPDGSRLTSPKTEEVGHLLFGSGMGLHTLFATHPPLIRRIQALEPDFTSDELERLSRRWEQDPPSGLAEDRALGVSETRTAAPLPSAREPVPVRPGAVTAQVGAPADGAYRRASSVIGEIPPALLARTRRGDLVTPLVYGLLLAEPDDIRATQLRVLATRHGQAMADAALAEARQVAALNPLLRLPLAQLSFPVLRTRSAHGKQELMATIDELIRADDRLSVFEYCLSRLLHRDLYESVYEHPPRRGRGRGRTAGLDAVATLLSVLASVGTADPAAAARAFAAGADGLLPQRLGYAPPGQGVLALEPVWPELDALSPAEKSRLVEALVRVIGRDETVTVAEFELLRTICAMIHCPVPVLAESGTVAG